MGSSVKEGAGIPQLNGTNYGKWRFRVRLFLEASEVWEALEEDVPEAVGEPRNKFLRMDRKAKSLLVGFVGDDCLAIVEEKGTAKEMWKALEDTFAKKSGASQTILRKRLATLRMKEGCSMRSHFAEFDELVRQLKNAGAKMEENDLVSQLFLTLPDSYDPLVTALENIQDKDLSLEMVKHRLLGEESKRVDRVDYYVEENSTAFIGGSNQMKKFKGRCYRCGKLGHMQKDCRSKMENRNANSVVAGKTVSFMVKPQCEVEEKEQAIHSFVIDSGCSDHFINNIKYLQNIRKLKEPFIVDVAKDGVTLVGEYEGTVRGKTKEGVILEMKNVIYLPELRSNLVSVKKMTHAGIDVLFTREDGFEKALMKLEKDVIGVAHMKQNLYELELQLETRRSANMCMTAVSTLKPRNEYFRFQATGMVMQNCMVDGRDRKSTHFCDACREPYKKNQELAFISLDNDTCGSENRDVKFPFHEQRDNDRFQQEGEMVGKNNAANGLQVH